MHSFVRSKKHVQILVKLDDFGMVNSRAACASYLICAIIPSLLFCFPQKLFWV